MRDHKLTAGAVAVRFLDDGRNMNQVGSLLGAEVLRTQARGYIVDASQLSKDAEFSVC